MDFTYLSHHSCNFFKNPPVVPRGCPEKSNALQCKKIPENWNWGWGGGGGGVKARKR